MPKESKLNLFSKLYPKSTTQEQLLRFSTEIEPVLDQQRTKGRKKGKKDEKNGLLEVGNNCRISKQKHFEYVRTVYGTSLAVKRTERTWYNTVRR